MSRQIDFLMEENKLNEIKEILNEEVLKYLALYPVAFRFKALTAIFIINKNELPLNDPLIQNILLFDKKVLENDNGLFSKHDLIFLENSFDQKLKQQIMQ